MGPAGDLRNNSAESSVQVDLARHHRRQHLGAVSHDRGSGLIARRLDPEDEEPVTSDPVALAVAALAVALAVACAAPIVFRRRWPSVMLVICVALTLAFNALGYFSPFVGAAVLVLIFTVATYCPARIAASLAGGALVVAYVGAVLGAVAGQIVATIFG